MKLPIKVICFVLPLLSTGFLHADNATPVATASPSKQFDDHFIEVQKAQLDKVIQQRDLITQKRAAMPSTPIMKYQEERMAFDKKLLTERRSYLDTLQAMAQPARAAAWREFNLKQAGERKSYNDSHKEEMDALRQQLQKQNIIRPDNSQQKKPQ